MPNDFDIVYKALSGFREITFNHRYGGMIKQYQLAQQAIEALKRIEQPELIEVKRDGKQRA